MVWQPPFADVEQQPRPLPGICGCSARTCIHKAWYQVVVGLVYALSCLTILAGTSQSKFMAEQEWSCYSVPLVRRSPI